MPYTTRMNGMDQLVISIGIQADIRQLPGPLGRFFIPLRPAATKFSWRLTATPAKSPNWPSGGSEVLCPIIPAKERRNLLD